MNSGRFSTSGRPLNETTKDRKQNDITIYKIKQNQWKYVTIVKINNSTNSTHLYRKMRFLHEMVLSNVIRRTLVFLLLAGNLKQSKMTIF